MGGLDGPKLCDQAVVRAGELRVVPEDVVSTLAAAQLVLANAADALHEKAEASTTNGPATFHGKIFIENQAEQRDEKDGVLITVSDNGNGVPEDIKQKIFDEFFTTKPAGQGTGLGLSMCAEIVRDHGGMLTIADSPDLGGARFELWLPVESPELEPR